MLEASDYPDLVLSGYPDQDGSDAWRRFWRVVRTCLRYLEKPSRRAVYIGQVTLVVRRSTPSNGLMLSRTRRALEDFDNQHEFERLTADVLNGLGYSSVEPMAPRGGADGGRDIRFREGDTSGVALVTLDKKIRDKFNRDLSKQDDSGGVIALFCSVDVSPSQKLGFAKDSIDRGYRLEVFDLERLRSLLDTSLKDVRRRYLGIDDEVATRLRSEITKLLRFPDAVADLSQSPTLLERLLVNTLPRRLFELLLTFEEGDVREVPGIGPALHDHLKNYYDFRQGALAVERQMLLRIGTMVSVRFSEGWSIYLKYVIMRFAGTSQEQIISGGDFLNYSISWEDAERVFRGLNDDSELATAMGGLLQIHQGLGDTLGGFVPTNDASDSSAV
jgi:hypothetical protein